jgi:hypothetical protein
VRGDGFVQCLVSKEMDQLKKVNNENAPKKCPSPRAMLIREPLFSIQPRPSHFSTPTSLIRLRKTLPIFHLRYFQIDSQSVLSNGQLFSIDHLAFMQVCGRQSRASTGTPELGGGSLKLTTLSKGVLKAADHCATRSVDVNSRASDGNDQS